VPYSTATDMVLAYGEQRMLTIADRDDDGVVDADVVAGAIARADELIKSYLHDYLANLVLVPSITEASMAIAYEYLHAASGSNEDSRLGFDRQIKWLTDIAKGVSVLPGQPNTDDGTIDPGDPLVSAPPRLWTRANASRLY
jgi:phage gp36-like protein